MSKEANNLPINQIVCGDCLEVMRDWPANSVHCCISSPPYWGLRDYGTDGQLGLEKTPEEYIAKMVEVFAEVKRVLRDDGSLWLNLGDSYNISVAGNKGPNTGVVNYQRSNSTKGKQQKLIRNGILKPKDLCGIPWRVALALQADGWYLRQDIIWAKPNPMPESVTDRCTKAHEYIFLLTKKARYFYDAEAIKEPSTGNSHAGRSDQQLSPRYQDDMKGFNQRAGTWNQTYLPETKNKRSVWTVNPKAFPEAHFATFPPKLIEPCILAGTSAKGCCPECGGPWERMVERTSLGVMGGVSRLKPEERGQYSERQGASQCDRDGLTQSLSETTGWRPTCKHCNDEFKVAWEPIPCIILDPFSGSGTTCLVAAQNGRSYVGVDVNPEYCEMARERLSAVDTGVPVKEARAGQMAMFNEEKKKC